MEVNMTNTVQEHVRGFKPMFTSILKKHLAENTEFENRKVLKNITCDNVKYIVHSLPPCKTQVIITCKLCISHLTVLQKEIFYQCPQSIRI